MLVNTSLSGWGSGRSRQKKKMYTVLSNDVDSSKNGVEVSIIPDLIRYHDQIEPIKKDTNSTKPETESI